MKNSTKVRLHLSKKLFESLTREIIKEAKANDGYTVAVKKPKAPKQVKEVNAVADTDKMKRMEGNVPTSTSTTSVQDMNMGNDGKPAIPGLKEKMSSKEKMAKGLYNEVDAEMDTDKMKKMKEANDFSNHYDYTYRLQDGNCIRINPETQERAKVHHSYCNHLKKEMEMNVAEEGQMNEMTDAVSWEAVAAGMAAMGLAPLAIDKMHQWWKKKYPKSFKAAQKLSGTIDKQMGGNTPGQGHGVDTSKTFGPQNEKNALKEYENDDYRVVNGQCRRYNDEHEYTVVSMSYCR